MSAKKMQKKQVTMAAWKAGSTGSAYATSEDTRADRLRKFVMRNLAVIIVAVLLVIAWLALSSVSSNRDAMLQSQRSEIVSLKQELTLEQDKTATERNAAIAEATGGMDADVKAADDRAMTELMKKALTWDGLREYLSRRDEVMKEYGFAADSEFMTAFMPGEAEGAVRTAPSGKTYSDFDASISSEFVSLESYVTSITSGSYSYFAVVQMRSKSSSGAKTADGQVMLVYDMIDGKPSNLNAYPVLGGVEKSG